MKVFKLCIIPIAYLLIGVFILLADYIIFDIIS